MNASGEHTRSLWMDVPVDPAAPRLTKNVRCDTVIVGAGIAGLSVAYELTAEGQKVVVVDRGPIAGGMTSRTTAHLAPVCDDGLSTLIGTRGEDIARLFQESHEAAVDRIEAIVAQESISCNFRRLDGFLFPATGKDPKQAREDRDEEFDAARKLGVRAEKAKGVPLSGFEQAPVLRYPDQATFHPLKYLAGVVTVLRERGAQLHADSPVEQIEETGAGVLVSVAGGGTIEAARAVVTTNAPVNDRFALHTKMSPYRTYAMAFTIPRGTLADGLYWDTGDPYHYVRLNPGPGSTNYLIAGGADHRTGEANDGDIRFESIESWIRALVPQLGKEVTRWSGQVLDTIDYCGFIGRNPGSKSIFISTGDSGQGMTHGVLAGLLLKDLITDKENPWAQVYDPERKTPSGLLNYVSENLANVKNLASRLGPGELDQGETPAPGEGGILRQGLQRIALCRDLEGKLHRLSATCTHLGCEVAWNTTEQCWDCPCHGSHFAPDGAVLNGPALLPLVKAK